MTENNLTRKNFKEDLETEGYFDIFEVISESDRLRIRRRVENFSPRMRRESDKFLIRKAD